MARIALDTLLLGGHGELHAGDEIPDTFNVGGGPEIETDFARLEELGLVEPVKARRGKADKADVVDEPQDEPQTD